MRSSAESEFASLFGPEHREPGAAVREQHLQWRTKRGASGSSPCGKGVTTGESTPRKSLLVHLDSFCCCAKGADSTRRGASDRRGAVRRRVRASGPGRHRARSSTPAQPAVARVPARGARASARARRVARDLDRRPEGLEAPHALEHARHPLRHRDDQVGCARGSSATTMKCARASAMRRFRPCASSVSSITRCPGPPIEETSACDASRTAGAGGCGRVRGWSARIMHT